MDNQIKTGIALAAAFGLPALAIAGPEAAPIEPPASNSGDWCSWLQSKPGTLYKNKENPFIQEFQIEGRLQYQMGYVDGENIAGGDFNEGYDEYRRARLGVKAKFLQYFGLKYQVNIVNDNRNGGGGELDWGYDSIDEAYVSFNLAKAIGNTGFDDLSLKYGRQKFVFGTEAHTSSTKLLTVERSALSNKVYGSSRPTGLTLEGA
ncbi:MAG: OprO/OprP family phosphate-selective porin, partial [Luteolibacter sp.]